MTRTPRFTRRTALVLALAACFAAPPGAAWAHAILIDSSPEAGGSVAAGLVTLTLRFNSRIDRARSRLTLNAPDGKSVVLQTAADPRPDVMIAAASLSPGAYSVRWQVLAVDGHITRGDVPFTVAAATAAKP